LPNPGKNPFYFPKDFTKRPENMVPPQKRKIALASSGYSLDEVKKVKKIKIG
jgi:hypothetical protein